MSRGLPKETKEYLCHLSLKNSKNGIAPTVGELFEKLQEKIEAKFDEIGAWLLAPIKKLVENYQHVCRLYHQQIKLLDELRTYQISARYLLHCFEIDVPFQPTPKHICKAREELRSCESIINNGIVQSCSQNWTMLGSCA
jgi:hypothetical protein